jgi:hypothetical protein
MQTLDNQTIEMQKGGKCQCRQIVIAALPFSKPVHVLHFWRRPYQALARGTTLPIQRSNVIKQALKAGIPNPRLLTQIQCLDRVEACTRQMKILKNQAGGLQCVHLWDCLIRAKEAGD